MDFPGAGRCPKFSTLGIISVGALLLTGIVKRMDPCRLAQGPDGSTLRPLILEFAENCCKFIPETFTQLVSLRRHKPDRVETDFLRRGTMHRIFQNFIGSLTSAQEPKAFRDAMAEAAAALDLSCLAYFSVPGRPRHAVRLISNYPALALSQGAP